MTVDSRNKVIISADDFGKCMEMDVAILKAFKSGFLTSTCIMSNGKNFEFALNEILPQCERLGMGCHLNIIEGKSFLEKGSKSHLCDSSGVFNKSFTQIMAGAKNKKFIVEVETEFRAQIEKTLERCKIDHLNSHVHVHGIPEIFELTCRLAAEYKIPAVRTQAEQPYFASDRKKYARMGMKDVSLNYAKNMLLNLFSKKNFETAKSYGIKTNDRFIGLLFTSYMDKGVILDGLRAVANESGASGIVCEVLVHPYFYENPTENDFRKFNEYLVTQDENIVKEVRDLGFEITNFSCYC